MAQAFPVEAQYVAAAAVVSVCLLMVAGWIPHPSSLWPRLFPFGCHTPIQQNDNENNNENYNENSGK